MIVCFQRTCTSKLYNRLSFSAISENCDVWSKMQGGGGGRGGGVHQKIENSFFGLNCSSSSLPLNAENRFTIRAVYNEIHVFNFFLYEVYIEANLSKF